MNADPEVMCWGEEHTTFFYRLALPAFIFYMIILPIGVPFYIANFHVEICVDDEGISKKVKVKNFPEHPKRKELNDKLIEKYGFLVKGYKH